MHAISNYYGFIHYPNFCEDYLEIIDFSNDNSYSNLCIVGYSIESIFHQVS